MNDKNNTKNYITNLNINGMNGRLLYLPSEKAKNNVEILFIYGHHSTLERWLGLVQVLSRYGNVSMPDLPGFGGMDSLYTIGKKPSIDNLADYLAAFIKLRYKNKRFVLVGMSFGFVVATRMLQRYPELCTKVTLMISVVGFAHYQDFTFSKVRYRAYLYLSKIISLRYSALFFRYVCLSPFLLRIAYANTHNAKHKFAKTETIEQFDSQMKVEIGLWHDNDVRTHFYTSQEFLTLDNCNKQVGVPLWHVSTTADHFFDHHLVEQHLRIIYRDFNTVEAKLETHAPSVIADAKMAEPFFPKPLIKALSNLQ